jgi:hypothetical protein
MNFPPSGEFNGIDSVQDDDDFSSSEDLHGRSNDIGEDGNHFPTEFDIPLNDEIRNEDDDGPRNEDHVLSHSSATIQGGHSLVGSPNNVEYDYSEDDIPPSEEDILDREDDDIPINIMETIQRSIASMTKDQGIGLDLFISIQIIPIIQGLGKNCSQAQVLLVI